MLAPLVYDTVAIGGQHAVENVQVRGFVQNKDELRREVLAPLWLLFQTQLLLIPHSPFTNLPSCHCFHIACSQVSTKAERNIVQEQAWQLLQTELLKQPQQASV